MAQEPLSVEGAEAAIQAGDSAKAEQTLKQIISQKPAPNDDALLREQEAALVRLGELYRDQKCVSERALPSSQRTRMQRECRLTDAASYRNVPALAETVRSSRTLMTSIAKAKTAKLSECAVVFVSLAWLPFLDDGVLTSCSALSCHRLTSRLSPIRRARQIPTTTKHAHTVRLLIDLFNDIPRASRRRST